MSHIQHYSPEFIKSIFTSYKDKLSQYRDIPLLKQIASLAAYLFANTSKFQDDRESFGKEREDVLLRCVIDQNFEDVAEYSDDFFKLIAIASRFQSLKRGLIIEALEHLDSGFDLFDKKLIQYCSKLGNLYDLWYMQWLKEIQPNSPASKQLEKMLANNEEIQKKFYNGYTIINLEGDKLTHKPYFEQFPKEIGEIVGLMDQLIEDMSGMAETESQKNHIAYFQQYATALRETNIDSLESQWRKLDTIWMSLRGEIQVVHDFEVYADPLRAKTTPDFSLRFLDPAYKKDNEYMATTIKETMTQYFKKRDTVLTKQGLFAFDNSLCAINCIPFSNACSLQFRFSGQAIPNDHDIRSKYGVKIYFDPVSTAARQKQTEKLIHKVMHDAEDLCKVMDPVDTITLHVAPHELGHSIYGLDSVKDVISVPTKTLLEEPRAELTALHTMLLLYRAKKIDEKLMQDTLISFAMQDLRRFAMYDSKSLRPYTISATNCSNIYEKHGFIRIEGDRAKVDATKTIPVLEELSTLFEKILDAEDKRDGETLEKVLEGMQVEGPLVKFFVSKLFDKKE